jgi:hypothetical protein
MIYAVDNGMEYSDHGIYFYDFPDDLPVEEGRWLLENAPGRYSNNEVILVAKECPFVGSIGASKIIVSWMDLEGMDLNGEWARRCPKSILLASIDHGVEDIKSWTGKPYCDPIRQQEHLTALATLRAWVEARP